MSPRRGTVVVASAALAARLAVVAWAGNRFPPAHDGVRYDALADRLSRGLGYTWLWPDGAVTAVSHYPVGYPAMLALAYRLLGHSVVAGALLATLLGALAAVAIHRTALLVTSPCVALLAGLAVALHPGLVAYTPALMTEVPTSALLALAAWATLACRSRPAWPRAALLGLVLGIATLVRPQALLVGPLLGAIAWGRRGVAACLVVATLVCAPWALRNAHAVGRATLSTNAGWNLRIGAQPGATGAWQSVVVPDTCRAVFGEAATDDCFQRAALEDIARAPGRWLALVPRKLGATFDLGGIGGFYLNLSNPGAFPWSAVLVAGAVETIFERAALTFGLLGMARASGKRARTRRALAVAGGVACVSPLGWVAVACLCAGLALLGRARLRERPLEATTLAVLATTAAVHAVFFGAPRYALLAAPLVTALGILGASEWWGARRRSTGEP